MSEAPDVLPSAAPPAVRGWVRRRLLASLGWMILGFAAVLFLAGGLSAAVGDRGERAAELAALFLPVSLAPCLHAGRLLRDALRARREARAARGGALELRADGFTLRRRRGGDVTASWRDLVALGREDTAPGRPLGAALVLVLVPARARPALLRLRAVYGIGISLDELEARLRARAAAFLGGEAGGFRGVAEAAGSGVATDADRDRALDAHCFTSACAGRELVPGCFVVRRRDGASVGLLCTPFALLAREGDAYRRVPWRAVGRLELGPASPYEFVPSDLLTLRDPAGEPLAQIPLSRLALPPAALAEVVGRYIYERGARAPAPEVTA